MQTRDVVVCVFHESDDVYDAITALREAGFPPDRIGFATTDHDADLALAEVAARGAAEVTAAERLVSALGQLGVPREDAAWYDQQLRRGATLIGVQAPGRTEEARAILLDFGGLDVVVARDIEAGRQWHEIAPSLRAQLGHQDAAWSTREPAYRFGYEAASSARDRGEPLRWHDHADRLRDTWLAERSEPWEEHEAAIRQGFDLGRGRRRIAEYPYSGKARTIGSALASASTGAVIGGLVGGPAGLVAGVMVGGALGALAGATFDRDERQEDETRP